MKFDPLSQSIQHWERIIDGEDDWIGADDCALCVAYYESGGSCPRCPLDKYGMYCSPTAEGSPWQAVSRAAGLRRLPPVDAWLSALRKAVSTMYIALLLVREAEESA